MSVKKELKQRMFTALSLAAALCVLSSCASSSSDTKTDAPANPDAGTLLEDNAKIGATDVSDSNAFADLESKKDAPAADEKKDAPEAAASTEAASTEGDTYYNSLGGETLRRVAFTLYSDKSFTKKLLAKNPDLKGVKKLSAEQKVYFDMDSVKPEPRFLTKDLLNRYADPLSARMQSEVKEKGLGETSVTLNKGESLQDLSQRIYGTHRYWPELYLVNKDKIANYDKVKAGLVLSAVNHPNLGVAKAETAPVMTTPSAATITPPEQPEQAEPEVAPTPAPEPVKVVTPEPLKMIKPEPVAKLPTQPAPTPIQKIEPVAKEVPKDPIPEVPPAPTTLEKVATPPPPVAPIAAEPLKPVETKPLPVVEAPKPLPVEHKAPEAADTVSANSSLRRILYVVLILVIGGAAFYFTRTPKRPKVDMLDLNASAGPRPKLAAKDNQESQLG
jgi:hypothetical protein